MYKEVFAERLRDTRKRSGYTQEEVAAELKINNTTLSSYERGKNEPDLEMLGKLATFYGTTIDWLIGRAAQSDEPNYIKKASVKISGGRNAVGDRATFIDRSATDKNCECKESDELKEIIRVYKNANIRGKAKILEVIASLEDEASSGK